MGVQNPQTITLNLNVDPADNKARSGYIVIPPPSPTSPYRLAEGYYLQSSPLAMEAIFPWYEVNPNSVQHYNSAYTGRKWECPVRFFGGSNPKIYEIIQAPAGMTITPFLTRNATTRNFEITDGYANLRWDNPVAGKHKIAVRCTDQNGNFSSRQWVLYVGTDRHLFTAPTQGGTGAGDPLNPKAWADVILGATTESPSKNKVLVMMAGNYTLASRLYINATYMARSIIADSGATVNVDNRFQVDSDHVFLSGITFKNVGTDPVNGFGIVYDEGLNNYWSVWRCKFDGCFNNTAGNNNQSCISANDKSQTIGRKKLLLSENTYLNTVNIHAHDLYNVDSYLCDRENFIIDNPAITSQAKSIWFPKLNCRAYEISFNTAIVPSITGFGDGALQVYNAVGSESAGNHAQQVEYNHIRTGNSGMVCIANRAANTTVPLAGPLIIDSYIRRNTFVGAGIEAANFDRASSVDRHSNFDSNLMQISNGSITVTGASNSSPVWFTDTNNTKGTSGVTDSSGAPIDSAQRGKRGSVVWSPE